MSYTPDFDAEYDVVIVGAGASGANVAHQLARAGKSVLILEAGRATRDDDDGWQGALEVYRTTVAKTPNSAFPPTQQAPQIDVLAVQNIKEGVPDDLGYLYQKGPQPFASDANRSKGGTTLHWLGIALRMLPNDFRMQSMYGVAVDWPIGYDELKSYYERAEYELGVAGNVDEYWLPGIDPATYWGDYVFPMQKIPETMVDKYFAKNLNGKDVSIFGDSYPLHVVPTPQARNSVPAKGYKNPETGMPERFQPVGSQEDPLTGQRCNGNGSCVGICPTQAKYSALRTLNAAQAAGHRMGSPVVIRCQSIATKIVTDPNTHRVTEIEYIAYEQSGATSVRKARGKCFVIAGHAIDTAKLCLLSGVANGSDQMGRNLMDHPTMLAWGLAKDPVYPFRSTGQISAITSFRDGPFRDRMSAFVVPVDEWGWIWPEFAPESTVEGFIAEGMLGRALRHRITDNITRQVTLQFELEQIPDPNNRVTIHPSIVDSMGIPRPVVDYNITDYNRLAMEKARDLSKEIFRMADIQDFTDYQPSDVVYLTYNGKGYVWKGCGHIVGTHRMGSDPATSVTDSWMRTWEHENLYLVGCGAMPTFGTSNPTLTMVALALRAAESILRDLGPSGGSKQ